MTKQLIPFTGPDPTPTLRLGHIRCLTYANLDLREENALYLNNLAWFWGTYGVLRQHGIVLSFRNNRNESHTVVDHRETPLSMAYFNVREVEWCERGYTIFVDFGYEISWVSSRCEVFVRRNWQCSNGNQSPSVYGGEKIFCKKDSLNHTGKSIWRPIFNNANGSIDHSDLAAVKAQFVTTQYGNVACMTQ